MMPFYKKVLLKLSGESLGGKNKSGIDVDVLRYFASQIAAAVQNKTQIAIVIGGGNIFRGLSSQAAEMDRVNADKMGMLATVINSLALADAVRNAGLDARVLTAFPIGTIGELYTKDTAMQYLNEGKVVIVAGGTGNPFFTTDTAAVLRAIEINADVILKGTRVDGVYDDDPEKNPQAKKFESISYKEVIDKNLRVMDITAISMAMDNKLPIVVFDLGNKDNLIKIISGEKIGTIVGT